MGYLSGGWEVLEIILRLCGYQLSNLVENKLSHKTNISCKTVVAPKNTKPPPFNLILSHSKIFPYSSINSEM